MKRITSVILIFSLTATTFAQTDIDVVTLKNGNIIKGKIIEHVINKHIKIELEGGSIFTFQYSEIESLKIEKKSSRTFGSGNNTVRPIVSSTPVRDCYNDGYASGQSVSTGGNMLGGLGSGFILGLIGWGISYVVVSGSNPEPPYREIESFEEECRRDYESGYKDGALKVKKSAVNIGGALGTLLIISLSLDSY